MKYSKFVGVDVSKNTLDFCILDQLSRHFIKIENNKESIEKIFLEDVILKLSRKSNTYFCIENTGYYNNHLIEYLTKRKISFSVPAPLYIKYSTGITREKTDKKDAERIAIFARKNFNELPLWQPFRPILIKLTALCSLRKKLLQIKIALQKKLKGSMNFTDPKIHLYISHCCKSSINAISDDLKNVEQEIDSLISSDVVLARLYEIICSVKGCGPVVATTMIIVTNEFKKFPGASEFACYAGIAPFERSSGVSLAKKPRISKMGSRELKALFHILSMSVIRCKGEYRQYYERKLKENKPKMVILNAIRNKIVRRIFCCVQEDRLYEPSYKLGSHKKA